MSREPTFRGYSTAYTSAAFTGYSYTRTRSGDNDTDDGENQEADTISAAEDSEALEGRDDLSLGNQTSLGEETASQTADGSVEGTESVVSERRRSSLAVRVA